MENNTSVSIMPPQKNPQLEMRGRKPGSGNFYSKTGVQKLAKLGFDPIEKMVMLYNEVVREMIRVRFDPVSGKPKERYSVMGYAQLLTTQQKLINDLMRYGYARVSETTIVKTDAKPAAIIRLTKAGDVFSLDESFEEDVGDGQSGGVNEECAPDELSTYIDSPDFVMGTRLINPSTLSVPK